MHACYGLTAKDYADFLRHLLYAIAVQYVVPGSQGSGCARAGGGVSRTECVVRRRPLSWGHGPGWVRVRVRVSGLPTVTRPTHREVETKTEQTTFKFKPDKLIKVTPHN